jgi:hypothetical protein
MRGFAFILLFWFVSSQSNNNTRPTNGCSPGNRVGAFLVLAPNSSSLLIVGTKTLIRWEYTNFVTKIPKTIDIKIQNVGDGIITTWSRGKVHVDSSLVIVPDLNVTNGAKAYEWTVIPAVNGNYRIRLVGDKKETFITPQQQIDGMRPPCFSNGEAQPGVSAEFRIVNPSLLAPSKDNFPPNRSSAIQTMQVALWITFLCWTVLF